MKWIKEILRELQEIKKLLLEIDCNQKQLWGKESSKVPFSPQAFSQHVGEGVRRALKCQDQQEPLQQQQEPVGTSKWEDVENQEKDRR